MYTRSYDEQRGILIPDSYGGTALSSPLSTDSTHNEDKTEASDPTASTASTEPKGDEKSEKTFSVFGFHLPNFISNSLKNTNLGLQKIGTEEILLIATAAFLFFSKEGDKECAVILLLLLFLG